MLNAVAAAGLGAAIILLLVFLRWRWKRLATTKSEESETYIPATQIPGQIFHRMCPHNNVIQGYEIEEKDSLDEHLDVLTRKLADKEGRLRLSKSKIRETQNEIENLHAIDHDVRSRYRDIMESLRTELMSNEKECKKLQEQIEWVSRRRAELKDEASCCIKQFGETNVRILNEEYDSIMRDFQSTPWPAAVRGGSNRINEQSVGITTG